MERRFHKKEAVDDDSTLVTSQLMFDNVKFIIALSHIQAHSSWSLVFTLIYFKINVRILNV